MKILHLKKAPESAEPRSARRLIWQCLRPSRRSLPAIAGAILAASVLPLIAPQFTRRLVDEAIAGTAVSRLMIIALGFLLFAVAGRAALMLTAWLASRLAWDGTNRLRERLAEHALGLDLDFHRKRTPGEMIERVDGDVAAIADFVVAFLLDVVVSVLLLAGVIMVVLAIDPRIGDALLAYCLLAGIIMVRLQTLAKPSAARVREQNAALIGNLEERLSGVEDLRANGAGEYAIHRFHQVSGKNYRVDLRATWIGSGLVAGSSVALAVGTALILGLAWWSRSSGALTVGTAVLLFQYTQLIRAPFERLIDQLRHYQAALGGIAKIESLLAQTPSLRSPDHPCELPPAGPLSLTLDEVGFCYDDDAEPVLSKITIDLLPGETLGLIGQTGSGKTTIARLILRLYDPTSGRVLIGGRDARDVDLSQLRQRLAVVTQDVQLFAASVRDNLTLFTDTADDDQLRDILIMVGLEDWLSALSAGLDTTLADGSAGLSAGEAQLLAFARAFLSDPGLVILDEASSRLDPATERKIERAMDRLLDSRTGVIIAHRLSSLSRVDKIAVIDHGKVIEYGRRNDLADDPDSHFARLLDAAGVRR